LFATAAAVFYVLFSSPAIGWRDGPEFTVTPVYLDVGHPSGFPTYSLLAKIFTWIPLGSIGFRVTLFTALMGAASLFVFAVLLKLLHSPRGEPARAPWLLSPLLLFALHKAVFASSTELEVYSLNTAFLLLLLYCAARWNSGDGIAWLYAGGFLYGISCGNHAAMSLYLPVLLILTLWGEPASENVGKPRRHAARVGLLAIFFLAGLSVYLYLLVRSMTDRLPVDLGRTDTLERFWLHISDAKDSETHFQGLVKFEDVAFVAPIQFRNLCSPLFFPSIPFFLWGLRSLWNGFRVLSVALPLLILINFVFFYYWIDGSSAFLPAIAAWFLPVSLGLGELGRALNARKALKPALAAVTAATIAVSAFFMAQNRISESDAESGFQSTEIYFPDLAAMPPESLAVYDNGWFSMAALQYAYSARPDVTLVLQTGLLNPAMMAVPEPEKMPLAYFPVRPDGKYMSAREPGFPSLFFAANLRSGRRVFFQYGTLADIMMPYLVPDDRYMWMGEMKMDHLAGIKALDAGLYDRFLERSEAYWNALASGGDGPVAVKAPTYMYYILYTVLEYMYSNGRYAETAEYAGKFLTAFAGPESRAFLPYDVLLNLYALQTDSYRKAGDSRAALASVEKLILWRPRHAENYLMLGFLLDEAGDGEGALEAWRRSAELAPLDYRIIARYATALAKHHSLDESAAFLESKQRELLENRLYDSAALISRQLQCLSLPPWEAGPYLPFPAAGPDGE
jgi:tetratricopeptide (TPR) repeat protein